MKPQEIIESNREYIEMALASGVSQRKIADDLHVGYQRIQYARRRWGLPMLKEPTRTGVNHASWKGGRYADSHGYVWVHTPDRGYTKPYTYEHILVSEQKLGRGLGSREVVHHINGIRNDNRPENLVVMDRAAHHRVHIMPDKLIADLVAAGLVKFDLDKGYVAA